MAAYLGPQNIKFLDLTHTVTFDSKGVTISTTDKDGDVITSFTFPFNKIEYVCKVIADYIASAKDEASR